MSTADGSAVAVEPLHDSSLPLSEFGVPCEPPVAFPNSEEVTPPTLENGGGDPLFEESGKSGQDENFSFPFETVSMTADTVGDAATPPTEDEAIASPVSAEESEYAKLLEKRMQPIYELVDSERTYVSSLKLVAEKYIPLCQEPLPGLEIPDALSSKWRIVWGNWIQLFEWHQSFLERLENLLRERQTEKIPKLFIDSKTRLRSYYSKYCENHRKAAIIAEQYRDFFEEVRVRIGDKQDVVSHLMKPVQRIMRYQLPMEGIVKCTDKAGLPSLALWTRALDIMKEIPGDTQLILEAARIDGYPGTITALGKVRILDDLRVATVTPAELQSLRSNPSSLQSTATSLASSTYSATNTNTAGGDNPLPLSSAAAAAAAGQAPNSASTPQSPGDSEDLLLKFQDRRLFLFDQSLLVTEEVKAKKNNPYAQSTYQFKSAVNVNKMKFESHWRNVSSTASASGDDEDELKFVIYDKSFGKEQVYVIDPRTISQREAWVVQLRDIQTMQQELLLALQDPKKFAERGARSAADDHLRPSSACNAAPAGPAAAKPQSPATLHAGGDATGRGKSSHSRVKSDIGEKRKGMSFMGDTKLRLPFGRKNDSKKSATITSSPKSPDGVGGSSLMLDSSSPLPRKESCPEVASIPTDNNNGSAQSPCGDEGGDGDGDGTGPTDETLETVNVMRRSKEDSTGIAVKVDLRKTTSTIPQQPGQTLLEGSVFPSPCSADTSMLTTPTTGAPPMPATAPLSHSSSSKKKGGGGSIFSIFGKSHKHKQQQANNSSSTNNNPE